MDFDAWTQPIDDPLRRKRLLAGYGIGTLGVACLVVVISLTSSGAAQEEPEEQVLDVQLAEEPEVEPEPEPEPESEPEPDPNPAPRPQGPVLPQLTTPTEIPDDQPAEAEAAADNPYGSGDPYMYGAGQRGTAPRKTVVVAPAPAPAPVAPKRPSGPVRVTEGTTPPKPLSQPQPGYPASAKAAGIEGTVVVKFVVTETGEPTQIQAVRGPEELRAACEAAVRNSKFSPAIRNGQPVSVYRVRRFTFRLST